MVDQFKIGWVYKNKVNDWFLIITDLRKWQADVMFCLEGLKFFPEHIIAADNKVCHTIFCDFNTPYEGKNRDTSWYTETGRNTANPRWGTEHNLILESGMSYEEWKKNGKELMKPYGIK